MIQNHRLSERAGCRLMGISRTGYLYIAKPRYDGLLRARMKGLAARQTAYGHPLLHALLRAEGLVVITSAAIVFSPTETCGCAPGTVKSYSVHGCPSKCHRVQTSAGQWILCRRAWVAVEASEF